MVWQSWRRKTKERALDKGGGVSAISREEESGIRLQPKCGARNPSTVTQSKSASSYWHLTSLVCYLIWAGSSSVLHIFCSLHDTLFLQGWTNSKGGISGQGPSLAGQRGEVHPTALETLPNQKKRDFAGKVEDALALFHSTCCIFLDFC